MFSRIFFRITIILGLSGSLIGCAELEQAENAAMNAARSASGAFQPTNGYWKPNGASGSPKIVVNLGQQRAYFYKGKQIIGQSTISTGRKGYETPPGHYHVTQKDEHHVSSIYGDYVGKGGHVVKANVSSAKDRAPPGAHFVGANMPYFLRFTSAYGMHAGYVPRYRASHGCIRMPTPMAKRFFNAAKLGTPVIVKD
jgi:hypothetical protein